MKDTKAKISSERKSEIGRLARAARKTQGGTA